VTARLNAGVKILHRLTNPIVAGNYSSMGIFYQMICALFFRRQQDWERRKNARIMLWTLVVSLGLALALATAIKLLNKH